MKEYKGIAVWQYKTELSTEKLKKHFDNIIENNDNVVRLLVNNKKIWGEAICDDPITGRQFIVNVYLKKEQK